MPRLVIAGLSGDSGKTVVSLSIIAALRKEGASVVPFKKGPDYIDASWLGCIAGRSCRNLDTYLVAPQDVLARFAGSVGSADTAVIEGNRGIHDGRDSSGTHSTAELAKLLKSPVILVVNTAKTTRTVAALIKGCIDFDHDVTYAGVILNRIAGERHKRVISEAIEKYCGLPVLGTIPRLGDDMSIIPGRHLGLVTPAESESSTNLNKLLVDIGTKYINIGALKNIALKAEPLEEHSEETAGTADEIVSIGYFKDSVFTFYYPENLEALERCGARLVPISSVEDASLPDIDALYIGGGFPETQADKLVNNKSMMESVKASALDGLPIYAECGGLIYLSKSITWNDKCYRMAELFPIDLKMNSRPVGHGYTELHVNKSNPFFEIGTVIKGHEFHYSGPVAGQDIPSGCMEVVTGSGIDKGSDGLTIKNTLACYTHIHADGMKQWALSLVKKAGEYKKSRPDGAAGNFKSSPRRNSRAA